MASASKRPKFLDNFQICTGASAGKASEDLKSRNVFLFQVPSKLDVQLLEGASIFLTGEAQVTLNPETEAVNTAESPLTLVSEGSSIHPASQPCILTPTEGAAGGGLELGVSISNHIRLLKHFFVPGLSYPEEEEDEVEMPQGLKQRWRPFGWKDPPVISREESSKHKKKKEKKHKKSRSEKS